MEMLNDREVNGQQVVEGLPLMEFGRKVLQAQPFSRMLGAELTEFKTGSAELRLVIRDELKQQHGFVHGGVVSYLADNALTFAGGSLFGDALTMEFKINYVSPVKGELIIARADALNKGGRNVVCRCDIWVIDAGEEKLCAIAQGTILGKPKT